MLKKLTKSKSYIKNGIKFKINKKNSFVPESKIYLEEENANKKTSLSFDLKDKIFEKFQFYLKKKIKYFI